MIAAIVIVIISKGIPINPIIPNIKNAAIKFGTTPIKESTKFLKRIKNIEKINNRIDELIETIKNKKFDNQIYKDQKVALKKDFETGLKTNDFWLSSILKAIKYNQNIEKVTYLNSIVDSITLNEIAKLAKQLLDDQYFESVSYLSE